MVTLNPIIDFSLAEKEYSELITFVNKMPLPGKHQLTHFLYPFCVYIYLFLLKNKKILEAKRFISIYSRMFSRTEGYAEVIQELVKIKTMEEVECHAYFKNFCEYKYKVKISEDNMKLLKEFLKNADCKILSNILQREFNIEEIKSQSSHEQTIETSSIEKREPSSHASERSETDSVISSIEKRKPTIYASERSETDPESSCIEKREPTSQASEIFETDSESSYIEKREPTTQASEKSETDSSTRSIDIKIESGELSSKIPFFHYTISGGEDQLCCVDINHKNTLLACGFESSSIYVWNIDPSVTNESVPKRFHSKEWKESLPRDLNYENVSPPSLRCVLKGHNGGVYGLAYAPGLLMSCSDDTTARAWSMTDFTDLYAYNAHKYPIWDITVSSNWSYFATASLDCTACLWSFDRTTPLRIFAGHSSDVDLVKFHSNSMYLATASTDKTVRLWVLGDGHSVRNFAGHDTYINSIVFSPDGKFIASADDSGCIKLWDLASGKLHRETAAHSKKILSICYSSDSSLIASCGFDRHIKIWDVKGTSLGISEERKNAALPLVDSYSVDSLPHYIRFCKNNLLISVGTQKRTDS